MEEGDSLATEEGRKKARTLAKLKSLKFSFPLPLREEEAFKVQRSSNVIFHLSPLSHAGT